jgi:hypothetical protein
MTINRIKISTMILTRITIRRMALIRMTIRTMTLIRIAISWMTIIRIAISWMTIIRITSNRITIKKVTIRRGQNSTKEKGFARQTSELIFYYFARGSVLKSWRRWKFLMGHYYCNFYCLSSLAKTTDI